MFSQPQCTAANKSFGECMFKAWGSVSVLSFSQTFSMGFISGDCAGHSV